MIFLVITFFFQAKDGIRDLTVTGVQTCALPIFTARAAAPVPAGGEGRLEVTVKVAEGWHVYGPGDPYRSEERRVGKEWTSRGSTRQRKRKQATGTALDERRSFLQAAALHGCPCQ